MAGLTDVGPADLIRFFGGAQIPFYVLKRPSDAVKSGRRMPNENNILGQTFWDVENGSCEYENNTYGSLNVFLKLFKPKGDSIWRYGHWNGEIMEYWRQKLIKMHPDIYKTAFASKRKRESYKDWLEEFLRKKGLLEWRPKKLLPVEAVLKKRPRDTCGDTSSRIAKRTRSFVPLNADEAASFASIDPTRKDEVAALLNPEECEYLLQCDGFKSSKIRFKAKYMSKAEVSQLESVVDETSQFWNNGNPMDMALDKALDFTALFQGENPKDSETGFKPEVSQMDLLEPDFDFAFERDFDICD